MSARLVVQLTEDAATGLTSATRSREGDAICQAVDAAGLTLAPQHPGIEDEPSLAAFFVVQADDPGQAERLQDELLALPGVEAAFIEPETSLP